MIKPRNLSPEALAFYDQSLPKLPLIDYNSPSELKAQTDVFWPIWQSLSDAIPFAHTFDPIYINDVRVYEVTPPEVIDESLLIVYIHGGSLVFGHPTIDKNIPVSLAHGSGIRTISIEYPLAPQHQFDAMLDAVLSVLHGIDRHYKNTMQFALVGHSAGASLALSAALKLKAMQQSMPNALVLLSPAIDQTFSGDSVITHASIDTNPATKEWVSQAAGVFIGTYTRDHPTVSPLFGDIENLCPSYIQQAGRDNFLSDATRLNRRLLAANVQCTLDVWDGLWHGFQMFPLVPESQAANAYSANWIKQQLMQKAADV